MLFFIYFLYFHVVCYLFYYFLCQFLVTKKSLISTNKVELSKFLLPNFYSYLKYLISFISLYRIRICDKPLKKEPDKMPVWLTPTHRRLLFKKWKSVQENPLYLYYKNYLHFLYVLKHISEAIITCLKFILILFYMFYFIVIQSCYCYLFGIACINKF